MDQPLSVLKNVGIASPCTMPWDEMAGDDRVRFCQACKLNVYNLSAMAADEAARLVTEREGRLCVRYYSRPDGTMLVADCPVARRAARSRLIRLLGRAAAALGLIVGSGVAFGSKGRFGGGLRVADVEPFAGIRRLFNPTVPAPVVGVMAMGEICVNPPPPPAPQTGPAQQIGPGRPVGGMITTQPIVRPAAKNRQESSE